MTAYRAGFKDGIEDRAYGWRNDDDWRELEHDHYESGYTTGANARYYAPEAREYYQGDD